MGEASEHNQLIIGLGTGRSGTVSLSYFLGAQDGIFSIHEGRIGEDRYLIPWENGEALLETWMKRLVRESQGFPFRVDVGSYYLPYVETLMKRFPGVKFICTQRKKEGVVDSFMRKTEEVNHWYEHEGKGWFKDPKWDPCFPKFDEPDKALAIGLYWDFYVKRSRELATQYPDQFLIVEIGELNTISGRQKILDFIGFEGERTLEGEFRANQITLTRKDKLVAKFKRRWRAIFDHG